MATTADFRNGLCIEFKNDLYQIIDFQHVKPGKGGAFVRTKLKSINTGKVLDNTFTAGEKVTTARIERRQFQYLYKDDIGYHFMNEQTFEQMSLPEEKVEQAKFLKEGGSVEILFHDETETPLNVELPQFLELEVTYTEPGVKGDTATNTMKSAELETGVTVQVPLFINQGEFIKVDTRTGNYVERVKSK